MLRHHKYATHRRLSGVVYSVRLVEKSKGVKRVLLSQARKSDSRGGVFVTGQQEGLRQ